MSSQPDSPDGQQHWLQAQGAATIIPFGDAAVQVIFGAAIDPAIHARAVACAEAVRARHWPGLLDVVPTYRAVTVHVDPRRLTVEAAIERVRTCVPSVAPVQTGTRHRLPVLYGGEWGPDLAEVAAFANRSVDDTIRLHAATVYRVYMLGFTPGFPYLGLVPDALAMPRLAGPRPRVPAGSVGIAGRQTGIYPVETPGGWRLIGRTPVALIRRRHPQPFLFTPGDEVEFVPIGREEFARLRQERDADAD